MAGYIDNSSDLALFESYSHGRAFAGAAIPTLSRYAQWSALMDGKTCDWCAWADLRVFDTTIEPYDPPMHHGCRCIIAYIMHDEFPPTPDWGSGPPTDAWPPGSYGNRIDPDIGMVPKPRLARPDLLVPGDDHYDRVDQMFGDPNDVDEYYELFGPKRRDDGDPVLRRIYEQLGFEGLPQKVSKEAWEKIDSQIHYRGLSGSTKYVDDLMHGDYFPGFGIHGNGTYSAWSDEVLEEARDTALQYAGSTGEAGLVRFKISPDARIIDSGDLRKLNDKAYDDFYEAHKNRLTELIQRNRAGELTDDQYYALRDAAKLQEARFHNVVNDPGRFAASLGYDAIDVMYAGGMGGTHFKVVLNRTIMIFEE